VTLIVPMDAGRRIRAHEKVLLAGEILSTYVSVRKWLRQRGIRQVMERLREGKGELAAVRTRADAHGTGVRLGHIVQKTLAVLPTDSRCLMRSLVLTRLLARRGIETSLVIGVRTEPAFGAHAWVEHDGVPLLPALDVLDRRLVEV
jgi:hypothetical protein